MEQYIKTKSVILIVFRSAEKALLALTAHPCLKHIYFNKCYFTERKDRVFGNILN